MKNNKIIYWIATVIMSIVFLFSAGMYLLNYDRAAGFFESLGFPVWIIYPLAIAKLLALVAILSRKSRVLVEWAYAGLLFDAILAFSSHTIVNDGQSAMALIAIITIIVSRVYHTKVFISLQA